MSTVEAEREEPIRLAVENVGGITRTEVAFTPGVTILAGRNATNRTSLLGALMAALGSERVSLKGDADEGHVELRFDDSTYTRTLTRTDGSGATAIDTGGDPYIDDAELADLFAFLLGTNEARRAVASGGDLRALIMRPIDTDALQAAIDESESAKRELDREIDRLDSLEDDLPDLEAEQEALDERIEAKGTRFDEVETDLENADADVEETREEKADLDAKLDELSSARSAVENARLDIESERRSVAALREERSGIDVPETDESVTTDIDELERELTERHDRVGALETTINELQTIIGFNEDVLEGEGASVAVLNALRDGRAGSGDENGRSENRTRAVTDQLIADTETVCWTCGSAVERDRIEATLERLREVRSEYFEERRALRGEIEELEERRGEIESRRRKRDERKRRLRTIDAEITDREDRLDDLEAKRAERERDVEALEAEVEALQAEEQSDLLDLHKRANRIEFELGRLGRERERITEEIESIGERVTERERLVAEREELDAELIDLRGRIERIEEQTLSAFNGHMETVLELLDYANIERIWLERRETEVREGRKKTPKSVFDLHVIRSGESGATYEDTISHLSESEREVTGLVFALAGYLAHDLYETMPFMLLDSLETIDSDRIAALVEYFGDYAEYVVVALLPEDAAALDDGYQRISDI